MITEAIQATEQDGQEEVWQRNVTWKNNHLVITKALAKLIKQREAWPRKAEIARETGLSRKTVYQHLEHFAIHPFMVEEIEQFKLMSGKVLANMCIKAIAGDIKAMRLSLEITGVLKGRRGGT